MTEQHYDANGDMIATSSQRFRHIGWRVNGGKHDGQLMTLTEAAAVNEDSETRFRAIEHGSISPIYVEIGKD